MIRNLKNNRFSFNRKWILRDYTQSSELNKINWFWLSGFIQGDGSFLVRRTRTGFVLYISQPLNDIQLLYKIKTFIGHGHVRIQEAEEMAHYVLQKQNGLAYALNNLGPFCGEKLNDYSLFLIKFSITTLNNNLSLIGFNNAWLSGFIDAEGSFYASYTKHRKMLSGHQLQLKFAITQKDVTVLKIIASLFNTRARYNKKGFYYFILSDCVSLDLIIDYLKKYPLLSKKSISLKKWLHLYNIYRNKQHLELSPDYLQSAAKAINDFSDEDIVRSSARVEQTSFDIF